MHNIHCLHIHYSLFNTFLLLFWFSQEFLIENECEFCLKLFSIYFSSNLVLISGSFWPFSSIFFLPEFFKFLIHLSSHDYLLFSGHFFPEFLYFCFVFFLLNSNYSIISPRNFGLNNFHLIDNNILVIFFFPMGMFCCSFPILETWCCVDVVFIPFWFLILD